MTDVHFLEEARALLRQFFAVRAERDKRGEPRPLYIIAPPHLERAIGEAAKEFNVAGEQPALVQVETTHVSIGGQFYEAKFAFLATQVAYVPALKRAGFILSEKGLEPGAISDPSKQDAFVWILVS